MFVVLIERGDNKRNIENIMYGKDIEIAREWVYNHLIREIQKMENDSTQVNSLGYKICENIEENQYEIIREYKKVNKGYIYNSFTRKTESILKASIFEYVDNQSINNKKKFLEQYHKILTEKMLTEQQQQKNELVVPKEKKD